MQAETDAACVVDAGKQAIHPAQVETIQRAFSPSPAGASFSLFCVPPHLPFLFLPDLTHSPAAHAEIERAQRILAQYDAAARDAGRGAYGLVGEDGSVEMMDAPMVRRFCSLSWRAGRTM